jgi:hypothetical protein
MMNKLVAPSILCRICSAQDMNSIMNFGDISLTGVFEKSGKSVPRAALELGICQKCGLVQLMHNYDLDHLYGDSYGYESHLNDSMSTHLKKKARNLENVFLRNKLNPVVVDIASNDGTLLNGYSDQVTTLVGIDPLIENLSDNYPVKSIKIPKFFSAEEYFNVLDVSATLVTSLSVLYDLNDPVEFATSVFNILDWEGIWHFEQSYLPTMINTLSYDTICHEHLLYLSLKDISNILERSGFKLYSASLNAINGGSIAITAVKTKSEVKAVPFVNHLMEMELKQAYAGGDPIKKFSIASLEHKQRLSRLLRQYKEQDYSLVGLGASTKGNVLLQWLDLNSSDIKTIGDINPKKFKRETPGSAIPIISENQLFDEVNERTIALVLPWHFRDSILAKGDRFFKNGGSMLFPLPEIQLVRF